MRHSVNAPAIWEKSLDSLERVCKYTEGFEEYPEVGKYTVYWLSLADDRRECKTKHTTQTLYDDLLGYIYYCELHKNYEGNERLIAVMNKLEQKKRRKKKSNSWL